MKSISTQRSFRQPYFALWLAMLMIGVSSAVASVNVKLSRDQTSVGIPVQLLVEVSGSTNVAVPQTIDVDGLQIQQTGRQTRVEVVNFRMRTSSILSYTIYPNREGEFEIPSFDVTVDGKREGTPALKLRVDAGGTGVPVQRALPATPGGTPQQQRLPQPAPGTQGVDDEKLAFAEMVLPTDPVFVGQVVPVEIRFFFNTGYPFEIQGNRPTVSGEGFTVQRMPDPQRGEQRIGNTDYHVFSFRTAITPLKSGEIELPSVTLQCVTRVPMSSMGSIDDLFEQFFQGGGMPGMGQAREITLATEPKTLTVKSLPREGKPENFSGAVGQFSMDATADPTKSGPGEPVTLHVTIDGQGNFDAMRDPLLVETGGWQTYPPTQNFVAQDDVGISGRKTFDFMMVAKSDQTGTPKAEFSYFDPEKTEYVTLSTNPVAVAAAAAVQGQRSESVADATAPAPASPPTVESENVEDAIGPVVTRSFSPWIRSAPAIVLNGLIAVVVIGLILAGILKRQRQTESGQLALRRKERAQLFKALSRNSSDEAFASAVLNVLKFDADLTGSIGAWGRVEALEAMPAHADDARKLREFLSVVDESRFSGLPGVETTRTVEKVEIIKILKKVAP